MCVYIIKADEMQKLLLLARKMTDDEDSESPRGAVQQVTV